MQNVLAFINWGLERVKRSSVPNGGIFPITPSLIGSVCQAEYLWGTHGRKATQSLLDSKFASYYSGHGWTEAEYAEATAGWVKRGQMLTDCQGLLDWFMGTDINANSNYKNYCTDKGLCSAISRPYVIGEAVFNGSALKKTHVGWVCGFMLDGDVLVMEARGLAHGVVITRMSQRAWKYRGLMTKKFSYEGALPFSTTGNFAFTRTLSYGCSGDDVIELKKLLIAEGYSAGLTINSSSSKNFYGSTREQVKNFQRDNGLTVDGKAGKNTIRALGGVWK